MSEIFPRELKWELPGTSRIPFLTYTSDELYQRELERFFYKGHWCYIGLEAEVPNPGDYKRTVGGFCQGGDAGPLIVTKK